MSGLQKLSPEDIKEIKRLSPIVDVARLVFRELAEKGKPTGEVSKRGEKYISCCCFHEEKNPSLHFDPKKGMFHCFGCEEGGDVISFVEKSLGLSFPEAIKYLADKFPAVNKIVKGKTYLSKGFKSLPDVKFDPADPDLEQLVSMMSFVQDFYQEQIRTNRSDLAIRARSYLSSRGINYSVIGTFGIGFAPKNDVVYTLMKEEFNIKQKDIGLFLRKLGLVSEEGFSVISGRITFPVGTVSGKTVGYTARTLSEDPKVAKYKNNPQSVIFDKNRVLYGMQFFDINQARTEGLFIVEGYTDMFGFIMQGKNNVLALGSTTLTEKQLGLIKHICPAAVYLMTDGDKPGVKGAIRNANRMAGVPGFYATEEGKGCPVYIVPISEGQDPCTLFFEEGKDISFYVKENSMPPQDFLLSLPSTSLLDDTDHPLGFLENHTYNVVAGQLIRDKFPGVGKRTKTAIHPDEPDPFLI